MGRISIAGGKIDGSDAAFQAAAQTALIKAPRITYPTASLTGTDRSPFVSVVPEVGTVFAVAHRHDDLLLVASGTDIVMNHVDAASNGGISIDTTTGIVTLPAGHVFLLEASFYTTTWSNTTGGWARYAFVDAATNTAVSGVAAWHAVVIPITATFAESSAPIAGILLETTTEMQVKIRVTDGAGTHTMRADSSSLRIIKIGSEALGYVRSQLRTLITNADTGATVVDSTVVPSKNYVRYSADLTNAAWIKGANHTPTAAANGAGYSRLVTSTSGVTQETYQTLQDSYTALMLGTESTASCEFILESAFTSLRLQLGDATDAVYASLDPATGIVTTGVTGAGALNASPYTLETLALGHFRLTLRGTPKAGNTTTPARLTITPTGSVTNAAVLIGNPSVTPGIVVPAHVKTTGRILNNAAAPRVISGHTASLDYLTSYDIQVQDIAVSGAKTALSSKIRFRTGLKASIALTGVTGTGNWVEMLIGESAGSVGAAFHLRGLANTFPTAAGNGGSLLLLNRRGGAAQQFYVISVSGTTPNRVARVAVLLDAATSLYIDDTAGSNQATALAALATGGTITQVGENYIHWFGANGTFTPAFAGNVRSLVVGAGAGADGGVAGAVYGHGGGGGRVLTRAANAVTATGFPVVIGQGSAGAPISTQGTAGGATTFNGLTAAGGTAGNNIAAGGNGGGSGNDIDGVVANYTGGADGGWSAGAGAGAGASVTATGASIDASNGATALGAAGYFSDITGSSVEYGKGGNGSGTATSVWDVSPANTGQGGGGHGATPRAGGSGVVIVAYPVWSGKTRHTAAVTGVS